MIDLKISYSYKICNRCCGGKHVTRIEILGEIYFFCSACLIRYTRLMLDAYSPNLKNRRCKCCKKDLDSDKIFTLFNEWFSCEKCSMEVAEAVLNHMES